MAQPKLTLVKGCGALKRSRTRRPPRLAVQPLIHAKLSASDELELVCAALGDNVGPLGNGSPADMQSLGNSGVGLEELNGRLLEHGRMVTIVSSRVQPLFAGNPVTSVDMGVGKPSKVAQAADFAGRLERAMGDEYTPVDLAKICGISGTAARKWLTGGGISPTHLFRISRYLNVNPEWLGAGIGKPERSPQCVHDDIPEKDIDLIRNFARVPGDVQKQIRSLVESLIPGQ